MDTRTEEDITEEELIENLEDKENKLSQQDDYNEIPPSDIVSFNELRSCAELVRMYQTNQIVIKPEFQRDVVWSKPSKTRFVDSLVKQLPVPSMCISLDYKTDERLVIDGLQRIDTIISFLMKDNVALSRLDDVDERISGKTPLQIKKEHPDIYSRFQNLMIPITVIRCDYSKKNHKNFLFKIFHRLNTGGNKLTNQEIRNCIYQGKFNNLLMSLVTYPKFRKLYRLEDDKTYRFAYEELILRFFALYETYESYNGSLARYLNDYMYDHKEDDSNIKKGLFYRVVDLMVSIFENYEQESRLSKALSEALFVGIGKNIEKLEKEDKKALLHRFTALRDDDNFSTDSLKSGLSKKESVTKRIKRAVEIFS
ncbi:DUF262 domain-containing protein [Candidatus Magnetominusculus xianensis]|uniref:GmrSD restriction endonucleases N-terminal domain-containing protein n=1 Tax=Candidatus Magnetominusculus xianensis TaxID=1748249 RepID=A0ABR5SHT8_9BACT|nr:DUF262 domain-containing protein [Candidatus Magnetominusculus xianensis]KWT90160.1 hypothetical protein ASN18_1166 [Candidatus Magnetominusculus xianensis]MBF0403653.1 DUF262 domain-containing protein [Nitrospirota bacterium]